VSNSINQFGAETRLWTPTPTITNGGGASQAPFSTETGDAWIIERDDHLALRLARDGDQEPFHIEETDSSLAIDWKGHYRSL
jgi:hypothetical protein